MNIATGTFGSGIPEHCPNCKTILDYEHLSAGWNATNGDETKLKEEDVERIFSNPYYCLSDWTIGKDGHEALVSEEVWIKSGIKLINEIGAEKYLKHLLDNLKGNWI